MENIETGSTGRLEAVFQTSFSLIDQIIVGRLGADAIAGVGLSNSFTFIVLLIYSALGTGSGALIAQALGRKDMEEVSATAAAGHMPPDKRDFWTAHSDDLSACAKRNAVGILPSGRDTKFVLAAHSFGRNV